MITTKTPPCRANCFDNFKRFTTENFSKYVAPILRENFHAVEVVDTESLNDKEFKHLDREHCIDGYFVTSDGNKEFFASRIQRGFYPTFTVRKDRDTGNVAEFVKLCGLIERGELYPKYFIQTYIKDSSSSITVVVETKKLIDFIQKTNPPVRHTRSEHIGQADFYVCNWQALKNFGADVLIFENKKSVT